MTGSDALELLTGAGVLELLVRLERDGLYAGSTWVGELARRLGVSSQKITPILKRLRAAGLVGRDRRPGRVGVPRWMPTDRGREVDAILEKRTASRGGVFRPLVQCGLSTREMLALR